MSALRHAALMLLRRSQLGSHIEKTAMSGSAIAAAAATVPLHSWTATRQVARVHSNTGASEQAEGEAAGSTAGVAQLQRDAVRVTGAVVLLAKRGVKRACCARALSRRKPRAASTASVLCARLGACVRSHAAAASHSLVPLQPVPLT